MNIRFISAGAGSGKTYRLTEILSERLTDAADAARPEAVIATTFTRKAAGELVDRVRQQLIANQKYRLANSMGQALIGTVNSVCGQLLVRYAFEAGLSPQLEVLAEAEQPVLFGQALEQAMTRDDIRVMNALAQRLGMTEWQQEIRKVVDLARANDVSAADLETHAQQSLDELMAFFPAPVEEDLDGPLETALRTAIDDIDENGDTTKTTRDYLVLLRSIAHQISQGRIQWSDWVKLSTKQPAKRSQSSAQPVRDIAARFEQHLGLHTDIRAWTQQLFALAARALTTYQGLKTERGLMDFVDQEHQVLRLLDLPEVSDSIAQELDLLLVDEFQDTSPIQLALFLKLAALAKECIWVGDIKQAIYGFRGTDPDLMNAVINKLEGEGIPTDILPYSWRSRPPLVEFVNALFVPAFSGYLNEAQVKLTSRRDETLAHPPLRFWMLEGSNEDKRATDLAEGVVNLLGQGLQVVDKQTGKRRPLLPGDVAILSRMNDKAVKYAAALTDRGIAVTLEQPGLLALPEIHLALACLRRLADAGDTLASAEIIALKTTQAPEAWLENRLEYLAEGNGSRNWGIDGTFQEPALVALEAMRPRLEFLSPSEVLDEALVAGDVRRDAKAWGPTKGRTSQRLANLETLCGLAADYEEYCQAQRISATVAGFLLWLYDLADEKLDKKGMDGQMDAVRVLTHHGAKGLEWPVVISADLETGTRGGLWGLSVLSDNETVDINAPLANRRLRYWPWPFAGMRKGIEVADRIDESPAGQADMQKQTAEAVRLLYVSFTRARDYLILPMQAKAKTRPWLDTLGADWLNPQEDALTLPDRQLVSCKLEVLESPQELIPLEPDSEQTWFPETKTIIEKLPAHIRPSMLPAAASATIGRQLEVGPRLLLQGNPDTEILGKALHNIFAADLITPNHADRASMAAGVLENHALTAHVAVNDVLACAARFYQCLNENFKPLVIHCEWPVTMILDNGQRMIGWIDALIETEEGWIIIDHKSFPGRRSEWDRKALSYSGQLDAYRQAVERVTDQPVISQWIHYSVGGGLVEVVI